MTDTVVLTYIHTSFWGTEEFEKSVRNVGLPIHNCWDPTIYKGVGSIMRMQYNALLKLKDQYKYVIYSDGADTYFVKPLTPLSSLMTVSAEIACFPDPELAKEYEWTEEYKSPWKYVNAGNWCGPIELIIKFFEEYGLNTYQDKEVNGQREWHHAYLKAIKDNFPIHLDIGCLMFQSTAFLSVMEDGKPNIFGLIKWENGIEIANMITGTKPAVFHGNGRTDLTWLYNLYK